MGDSQIMAKGAPIRRELERDGYVTSDPDKKTEANSSEVAVDQGDTSDSSNN